MVQLHRRAECVKVLGTTADVFVSLNFLKESSFPKISDGGSNPDNERKNKDPKQAAANPECFFCFHLLNLEIIMRRTRGLPVEFLLLMTPTRTQLCQLPTPCHRLFGVSEDLGMDIWIKRDDLTGFAFGGNKGRKLEYLISDVLRAGSTHVVTCGSVQSNFIRQLGAACAMKGIQLTAVVMDVPFEDAMPKEIGLADTSGNKFLGDLLGVDWVVLPNGTWDELFAEMERRAIAFEEAGELVYRIPVGGSSPLGAFGFYQAVAEIRSLQFNVVVFASSSGSTQAGLAYGLHGSQTRLIGIACDPEPEIHFDFAELGYNMANELGLPFRITPEEFEVDLRFVGPGYGIPSEEGQHAIQYLAKREGIFLDPIYSGKAFAGLIQLARNHEIEGKVCFWHTGGLPSLFALPFARG
jgi:D-cysteine desulfhydrase/L-cysteate sulfo-lyase